jgi:hypothetical protein
VKTLRLERRGRDIPPVIETPTAFVKHPAFDRLVPCELILIAPNLEHLYCDPEFKLLKRTRIPKLLTLNGNMNIALKHFPKTKLVVTNFHNSPRLLYAMLPETLRHLEFTVGGHELIFIHPHKLPPYLETLIIPFTWRLIPARNEIQNESSDVTPLSVLPTTLTHVSDVSCNYTLSQILLLPRLQSLSLTKHIRLTARLPSSLTDLSIFTNTLDDLIRIKSSHGPKTQPLFPPQLKSLKIWSKKNSTYDIEWLGKLVSNDELPRSLTSFETNSLLIENTDHLKRLPPSLKRLILPNFVANSRFDFNEIGSCLEILNIGILWASLDSVDSVDRVVRFPTALKYLTLQPRGKLCPNEHLAGGFPRHLKELVLVDDFHFLDGDQVTELVPKLPCGLEKFSVCSVDDSPRSAANWYWPNHLLEQLPCDLQALDLPGSRILLGQLHLLPRNLLFCSLRITFTRSDASGVGLSSALKNLPPKMSSFIVE